MARAADRDRAPAARLATLVAVPVALAAGVAAFLLLGRAPAGPDPTAPTTGPVAGPVAGPTAAVPTGPVLMAAPRLAADARAACAAFVGELPPAVRGQPRRPVTAGPDQNAAYGEPPVTVACGGARPSYGLTDDVSILSGVCWHATPGSAGTVWATLDRDVPVRVTVPAGYDPPGQWVIAFSAPVAAALPPATDAPSGCLPAPG